MAFQNLLDTIKWPTLSLPVGDRVYEIPEVSGETYVRLVAINATFEANPRPDAEVFALALGEDLYARMQAELPHSQLAVVGTTAYFWQLRLHALAEEFWNSGGKALRDREPTRTRTRRAIPSAAATTTRRRASGSGTSTPQTSASSATG